MKNRLLLAGCFMVSSLCSAQVGIGTIHPHPKSILDLSSTSKGLLVPRMTGLQKHNLSLSSGDAGMIVFQTDIPPAPLPPTSPGLYFFEGNQWVAPVLNGTVNGQTLRWDGNKWVGTSNLFNQGSSIGLGTTAPNVQFQIHSNSTWTRFQLTNGNSNSFQYDGLVIGVSQNATEAYLVQQEQKPLWLGTSNVERMRIDAEGNVGIGTSEPMAKLDVRGTIRIGQEGTAIRCLMKSSMVIQVPAIGSHTEAIVQIPCPNTLENATVFVSPASSLSDLMIGYARVSAAGQVEVKFINMGANETPPQELTLHISVIQ